MNRKRLFVIAGITVAALAVATVTTVGQTAGPPATAGGGGGDSRQGVVQCANLIYARDRSSVCFSDAFLAQVQKDTNIKTNRRFYSVKLDSAEVFGYPFAVMTGEGSFSLPQTQRRNLRDYLTRGGFLVASAGCSSQAWNLSFRAEIRQIFPKRKLKKLPLSHPIYHTVYDIKNLDTKRQGVKTLLEGLEIDGKIVLVYSPEGLNDTPNTVGCCCCGGNEIHNAKQVNANLLAYALTH
jgi:hypothetical protein